MVNWTAFTDGMAAARSSGAPAAQATSAEAKAAGGPDFLRDAEDDDQRSWQLGYDRAVEMARR